MNNKEQSNFEFAKLAVKKFDEYKTALSENKKIGDREYRHMATAIHGCKLVLQGIIDEGEKYKVKLAK